MRESGKPTKRDGESCNFALALQFKRADVPREEVIEALEAVLRSLREEA